MNELLNSCMHTAFEDDTSSIVTLCSESGVLSALNEVMRYISLITFESPLGHQICIRNATSIIDSVKAFLSAVDAETTTSDLGESVNLNRLGIRQCIEGLVQAVLCIDSVVRCLEVKRMVVLLEKVVSDFFVSWDRSMH